MILLTNQITTAVLLYFIHIRNYTWFKNRFSCPPVCIILEMMIMIDDDGYDYWWWPFRMIMIHDHGYYWWWLLILLMLLMLLMLLLMMMAMINDKWLWWWWWWKWSSCPPPFLSVETAVQQGGRSVEEPRLKLDEFPGGHGTSTISSGCFCSKAMVCLVENLQKTAIEIIGK